MRHALSFENVWFKVIWHILGRETYFCGALYIKRLKVSAHADDHKTFWTLWTLKKWKSDWTLVVFGNEKRVNVEGPHGIKYYWRELKILNEVFSKRIYRGRSVMVWDATWCNGNLDMVGIERKCMPIITWRLSHRFYLLQMVRLLKVNGFCNRITLLYVKCFSIIMYILDGDDVKVSIWPSRSPDLNIL